MAFTRIDRDPTESRGQASHLKQGFSQMGGYLSREVWDSWDSWDSWDRGVWWDGVSI